MAADELLRAELTRAARALGAPDDVSPLLERPRDPAFGDWATNLAMVLAKPFGKKPRDFAQQIIDAMDLARGGVQSAEIAGPGFINFRVATDTLVRGLLALVQAGRTYGRDHAAAGQPVNVEFVSANPTGPLHVGHGRQAALGDAISSLLEATGWAVTREFYYNDAGAQIMNLATSVQTRIAQLRGRDAGDSGRRLSRRVHPRDRRSATSTPTPAIRRAPTWTRCAGSPCRNCARNRTATCRPSG